MRAARLCLTLAAIALLADSAEAVDLQKIDRSIRKEPVYQSENPQYCLLVFGPKANVRVWLVADGDGLYVDRNGNGDLTDPDERFNPDSVFHDMSGRPEVKLMRSFFLRLPNDFQTSRSCHAHPNVFGLIVEQSIPVDDREDASVKRVRKRPFRVCIGDPRCGQDSTLAFASRPADAPILYVDGPLHLDLHRYSDTLHRGETRWLEVQGLNPGLGATFRLELPEGMNDIHPVAEIECPPRWPGAEPIRFRIELPGRG